MKCMLILIALMSLGGCAGEKTTDTRVNDPSHPWDNSAFRSSEEERVTHNEKPLSRYEICMMDLRGAPNAKDLCVKRMTETYTPKPNDCHDSGEEKK